MDNTNGADTAHLLFLWSPGGYTLEVRPGPPPAVGQEIAVDHLTLVVTKIGVSPLPGDSRPCAFTVGRG
ncbi:MAG: hypothetical protein WCH31_05125 [Actinomycetes bacterium]